MFGSIDFFKSSSVSDKLESRAYISPTQVSLIVADCPGIRDFFWSLGSRQVCPSTTVVVAIANERFNVASGDPERKDACPDTTISRRNGFVFCGCATQMRNIFHNRASQSSSSPVCDTATSDRRQRDARFCGFYVCDLCFPHVTLYIYILNHCSHRQQVAL